MRKAENGHVYPIEVLLVKQSLQDLGFSEADQEWLVRVIKRPDCLGDASGTSFNREIFECFLYDQNPRWIVEELGAPYSNRKRPANIPSTPFSVFCTSYLLTISMRSRSSLQIFQDGLPNFGSMQVSLPNIWIFTN